MDQLMTHRTTRHRSASGFTLIETVVALGILAVAVLAVAASLLTAIKYSARSRMATEAMYLAEDQLEIMRLLSAADVLAMVPNENFVDDGLNPIDPDPGDDSATTYNRRWRVQQDLPEAGLLTITVEVDYQDRLGMTRTVSMRTLKAGV
jgi:type IV pilus modification protein PilV